MRKKKKRTKNISTSQNRTVGDVGTSFIILFFAIPCFWMSLMFSVGVGEHVSDLKTYENLEQSEQKKVKIKQFEEDILFDLTRAVLASLIGIFIIKKRAYIFEKIKHWELGSN